jgi:hypothetical protein
VIAQYADGRGSGRCEAGRSGTSPGRHRDEGRAPVVLGAAAPRGAGVAAFRSPWADARTVPGRPDRSRLSEGRNPFLPCPQSSGSASHVSYGRSPPRPALEPSAGPGLCPRGCLEPGLTIRPPPEPQGPSRAGSSRQGTARALAHSGRRHGRHQAAAAVTSSRGSHREHASVGGSRSEAVKSPCGRGQTRDTTADTMRVSRTHGSPR